MAKGSFRRPLPAKELRWVCAPSRFRDADGSRSKALVESVGQSAAIEALRLGVELYGPGYNVFVEGLPGLGKSGLVRKLLEELTPQCAFPQDRVYVSCFENPERPRLLQLPHTLIGASEGKQGRAERDHLKQVQAKRGHRQR